MASGFVCAIPQTGGLPLGCVLSVILSEAKNLTPGRRLDYLEILRFAQNDRRLRSELQDSTREQ